MFHLQANADVRHGLERPRQDLEQNTIATATVLEAMRAEGVTRIAFSSTGSVYGEPEVFPTPEDAPFPLQTSLYGASKLAGEGMIGAYAHGFGFTGVVLRFVSILGERYTHGHVYDFYCALKRDPHRLRVLGDGRQEKSYLYVEDCIDGILAAAAGARVPAGRGGRLQPRPRRDRRRRRLGGADHRAHGRLSGDRVRRGPARMGRRQPADPPRLLAHPLPGLGADAHDPRVDLRTLEWFDANPYAWESAIASQAGAI